MNVTALLEPLSNNDLFSKYMRLINLTLSCTGILTNFILLIILLLLHRYHCTTYFLLILMIMCDFLYCMVYTSILLTIDHYINIINHQILCPLSFFLSPFTFTGSTLLLFICLLHLITNYVRKYETTLGQIGGRLSVIFIFAFVIIRSVLGSTSIELISDPMIPHIRHCTIDTNTPDIVTTVQNINYIFAEVTDIIVYISWIIIILIYIISLFHWKKRVKTNRKKSSFALFLTITQEQNILSSINEERLINKQRHKNISSIILSISLISILFYLPVMMNKFISMNLIYRNQAFLTNKQIMFLHAIQQTAHLFCLAIRFIPYFIFDKRFNLFFHQMIGMKIQRKNPSKQEKRLQKYICRCQCSRRQQSLELNDYQHEHRPTHI